jgi:hypothetical protein
MIFPPPKTPRPVAHGNQVSKYFKFAIKISGNSSQDTVFIESLFLILKDRFF